MSQSSEDAAIQAVNTDLVNVANSITSATSNLSTLLTQLEAEVAAGGVQPSTVTALQNTQAQLDNAAQALTNVATPPVTPPAS